MNANTALRAALTALILVLFTACNIKEKKTDEPDKADKDEKPPVELTTLKRGPIEAVIRATANLEAEQEIQVISRASNPVVELLVEEGDVVEKDQILVRLDDRTQKLRLNKAEARLAKAKQDYNRTQNLTQQKMIPKQDFIDAGFELEQAELELKEAREDLIYTEIKAPISGTVTQRMVKLGDQVAVAQHLFDIIDFDSMVARVYLPESNLARLRVGQEARIESQALNADFEGYVKRIAPVVDAGTGTVKVTVGLSEMGRLRPGMYVDVALILETHHNALLIPKRALVYDGDQMYVFRYKGNDRVERLPLQPLLMDKNNVEPTGDFREGDRIVVAGQTGLKPDAEVRVIDPNAAPSTPTPNVNPKAPVDEEPVKAAVQ